MRLPHASVLFSLLAIVAILDPLATAAEKKVPDPALVKKYAAWLPKTPQGVGRPIDDRKAWETLAKSPAFKDVVARAEKVLKTTAPDLTDDIYLDFSRTGNRSRGERVLGQRHSRLPQLLLAECLENKGRFLTAIEEEIRATASEKSWTLPAHDRSLSNFKGTELDIDLASSALSWNLATADYWLGDKLSAEVRKLVRSELERRTFAPYRGYLAKGKPRLWWATGTNNWNAVCLAGVTGAALAIVESPDDRAVYAAAADQFIEYFLSGFTSDGYCSEGVGYWNYGFGHFLLLTETIHQATGGQADWMERPKVRQIAEFARHLGILPGVYPAFADCSVNSKPAAWIQGYVSRRYGLGWKDEEQQGIGLALGPVGSPSELGVLVFPNSVFARPASVATAEASPLRNWFSEAGILICRPAAGSQHAMGAALKGGHNAEHHNHNDVGSYVVALGAATPLLDPGSEVYTARTFSAKRYDSNVLNSFGHAVPRVAGKLQETGRQAAAKILKTDFTEGADTLAMDIRSCYAVKDLETLTRTFVFSRQGRGSLTVTDAVKFSHPERFGTAMITISKWRELSPGRLEIGEGPDGVQVTISTDGPKFGLEPEEIHEDLHGHIVPIRLGIELSEPVAAASITVRIEPK